ncbi:MAG: flavodoxin family protein [Bilifractor sp.]
MKIVMIYGQNHNGSTCHIARELAEKLRGESTEFFLPRDFGSFCTGCCQCLYVSEGKCPHAEKISPIVQAIDTADVLILASPVYVYHVTGSMKAFLDHLAYRWMLHRPEPSMFRKQAVCICTAAGSGTRTTLKDMADSLFFWGVGRIYRYGTRVYAVRWDKVTQKKKNSIDRATTKLAAKITSKYGRVHPGLKTKAMFFIMRMIQKKGTTQKDREYWEKMGWLGHVRPWNG